MGKLNISIVESDPIDSIDSATTSAGPSKKKPKTATKRSTNKTDAKSVTIDTGEKSNGDTRDSLESDLIKKDPKVTKVSRPSKNSKNAKDPLGVVKNEDPLSPKNDVGNMISVNVSQTGIPKTLLIPLERSPPTDTRPGYFPLLARFNEVYPAKTDVLCWWCCHNFDTHPIGIPMKYDEHEDVFKVIGCFCSLNCAFAHSKMEKLPVHLSDF